MPKSTFTLPDPSLLLTDKKCQDFLDIYSVHSDNIDEARHAAGISEDVARTLIFIDQYKKTETLTQSYRAAGLNEREAYLIIKMFNLNSLKDKDIPLDKLHDFYTALEFGETTENAAEYSEIKITTAKRLYRERIVDLGKERRVNNKRLDLLRQIVPRQNILSIATATGVTPRFIMDICSTRSLHMKAQDKIAFVIKLRETHPAKNKLINQFAETIEARNTKSVKQAKMNKEEKEIKYRSEISGILKEWREEIKLTIPQVKEMINNVQYRAVLSNRERMTVSNGLERIEDGTMKSISVYELAVKILPKIYSNHTQKHQRAKGRRYIARLNTSIDLK